VDPTNFEHKYKLAYLFHLIIAHLLSIPCTVCKMGLILRSIEQMLKKKFSMARKFTLQPLRRYDVKPPEKTAQT
jgi:hypothetical protein